MSFVLLWVAIVSTALFWVAMHAAWIDRLPVWPLRILLLIVFALVPLTMFGTLVRGATNLSLTTTIAPTWLGYAWSQLSAYVAGAALILYWGRRRQADARPAAAHWRIWPLMLGWFVSGVVWSAVFAYMDHAWLARYAEARSQAKSNYLAHMTPNSAQAATAAHLYEMAFARLVSDPDTKMRDLPSLWYGDFDVNNPTLVAYLGRERLTITYLRQAATFQGCRFEQDTADPNISGTGPDQPHEEQAAVLLGLDAREEIAQGRIASAMADANAAFVMARNIGQRSTLIQGLTGAGADGVACNALEAALPAVRSKAELAPLRLDDLPPLSSAIQQSLRGEEWFDLDRAVNATSPAGIKASQGQTPRLMSADAYPSAFVRVFEMNADPLVRFMRSIQDVSAQPYYKAQDKLSDLNEIGHTMGIANLLVPAMMNSLTAATRAETTESCARVGVAMTRYRLDHGTLPTTLDQLVPAYLDAVPIDPYDGNPLRLNTVDGASVIYSIGPDGMDNGGVPINERTGQGDIIFTLKPAIAGAATKP